MAAAVIKAHKSELVTARRAINALAYLWIVLATALLAIDALTIAREPPPADMFDVRPLPIYILGVPWLIAVLAAAACLAEMQTSPRSHAPVWWLVVVLAAYGYWLVVLPVEPIEPAARWIGAGAVLLTATAVVVLDIIDLFRMVRTRRAASTSLRPGSPS